MTGPLTREAILKKLNLRWFGRLCTLRIHVGSNLFVKWSVASLVRRCLSNMTDHISIHNNILLLVTFVCVLWFRSRMLPFFLGSLFHHHHQTTPDPALFVKVCICICVILVSLFSFLMVIRLMCKVLTFSSGDLPCYQTTPVSDSLFQRPRHHPVQNPHTTHCWLLPSEAQA